MSTGGSTESNVRSFEAFLTINNYIPTKKNPLKSEITKVLSKI
jgi:hypothetical protein